MTIQRREMVSFLAFGEILWLELQPRETVKSMFF